MAYLQPTMRMYHDILFPRVALCHLVEETFFFKLLQKTHVDELLGLDGLIAAASHRNPNISFHIFSYLG